MSNQLLTKQYVAEAAINANRIVKYGSTDDFVVQSAAVGDAMFGVVEGVAPALGERCDVVTHGVAEVKLGGTVVRGGPITSDATGQGVAAAPAAGVNNRIVGYARQSGVIGDVIEVQLAPSTLQG